jgi:hypothetical protein
MDSEKEMLITVEYEKQHKEEYAKFYKEQEDNMKEFKLQQLMRGIQFVEEQRKKRNELGIIEYLEPSIDVLSLKHVVNIHMTSLNRIRDEMYNILVDSFKMFKKLYPLLDDNMSKELKEFENDLFIRGRKNSDQCKYTTFYKV